MYVVNLRMKMEKVSEKVKFMNGYSKSEIAEGELGFLEEF